MHLDNRNAVCHCNAFAFMVSQDRMRQVYRSIRVEASASWDRQVADDDIHNLQHKSI